MICYIFTFYYIWTTLYKGFILYVLMAYIQSISERSCLSFSLNERGNEAHSWKPVWTLSHRKLIVDKCFGCLSQVKYQCLHQSEHSFSLLCDFCHSVKRYKKSQMEQKWLAMETSVNISLKWQQITVYIQIHKVWQSSANRYVWCHRLPMTSTVGWQRTRMHGRPVPFWANLWRPRKVTWGIKKGKLTNCMELLTSAFMCQVLKKEGDIKKFSYLWLNTVHKLHLQYVLWIASICQELPLRKDSKCPKLALGKVLLYNETHCNCTALGLGTFLDLGLGGISCFFIIVLIIRHRLYNTGKNIVRTSQFVGYPWNPKSSSSF